MVQSTSNTAETILSSPHGALRHRSKRWHVREKLHEMIIDGQFPPGSRLVQQDLAKHLKTSVSVVRELLLALANIGLVDMEENHGFVVAKLDMQRLTDTYMLRAMHEALAVRFCCEKASRSDFRQLREMASKIVAMHETDNPQQRREAAKLDRDLHAMLVRIADSETLNRAWRTHWTPMITVRKFPAAHRYKESFDEHLALIDAIEQNRPDDAERLVRTHILNGLNYLKECIGAGDADLQWLA